MKLIKQLINKVRGHEHRYIIRYDDREDFGDGKRHTFRVTLCEECGDIKSIEQLT